MNKCDFCGATEVAWFYPAKNFDYMVVDGNTYRSLGEWAACETCADLIEKGDREGLVERSTDYSSYDYGLSQEMKRLLKVELDNFHGFFWKNREGKRWKEGDADPAEHRLSGSMAPRGA